MPLRRQQGCHPPTARLKTQIGERRKKGDSRPTLVRYRAGGKGESTQAPRGVEQAVIPVADTPFFDVRVRREIKILGGAGDGKFPSAALSHCCVFEAIAVGVFWGGACGPTTRFRATGAQMKLRCCSGRGGQACAKASRCSGVP